MFGRPTDSFSSTSCPPYPKAEIRIELGQLCKLVIAEIDSDAWVSGPKIAFSLEVHSSNRGTVLEGKLDLSKPEELRVLIVHHSTIHQGGDPKSAMKMTTSHFAR